MSDALALPSMAASALTQVLDFLIRRAEVMLDRRASADGGDSSADLCVTPAVVARAPGALDFDRASLTPEAVLRIRSAVELLGVYAEHPELIRADDQRLQRHLAALRSALEEAYGQPITLEGESGPRAGVRIRQDEDEVYGVVRGARVGQVSAGARLEVTQVSKVVHEGAEVIGGEFDHLG